MNTRPIDYITEDFYESLSFMDGEQPDLNTIRELFLEDAMLVNMSFGKPVTYSVNSFAHMLEDQVNEGALTQFMQRELYATTNIFGRIAQRTSVYQYSFSYHDVDDAPCGINYIQYIQVDDLWRISSMIWNDESANFKIPADMKGF